MSALDRILKGEIVRVAGVRAEVRAARPGDPVRNAPAGALATQNWYTGRNMPQPEQFSAISGVEGAYLANLYVFKCVDTIAKSLAGLAFRAGYDPSKKGSYNTASPLAKLLGPAPGSPNPQWSAATLWRYAAAQWVIMGKIGWANGYDQVTGGVNALWPLAVQYLHPIPGPATGEDYFSSYQYGTPGSPMFRDYPSDKVTYLWRPSLADFRQPESVIQAAQLPISVLRMIDAYDYGFLKNNAVPSTIITTEPFAEPEQRRAFRDQFMAEFSGYNNAGKTMFVERGFDDESANGSQVSDSVSVQRLGLTQQEAQQGQTRDAKIRDVCVAMGVPLSVLMDSSLAKFQNADQDYRNFWQLTMLPLLREIEDAINIHLAPALGSEVGWFDTSQVAALQAPKTFKPQDAVELVTARLITRDEFRQDLGLPAWSEVDPEDLPVIYPGVSTTAAGGEVGTPSPTDTGVVVDDGVPPAAPAVTPIAAARARRNQRALVEKVEELDQRVTAGEREVRSVIDVRHAGHGGHLNIPGGHLTDSASPNNVRKAFEQMLSTGMQALFAEQAKNAADRLNGRRGRKAAATAVSDVDALFNADYWASRTAAVLEPLLLGLSQLEGRSMQWHDMAEQLGRDITAETTASLGLALSGLGSQDRPAAIADVFTSGPDKAIALAMQQITAIDARSAEQGVTRSRVEQLLLAVHQGQMTADAAVAELQEAAS